jgi:hypothetical protein
MIDIISSGLMKKNVIFLEEKDDSTTTGLMPKMP